MRVYLFLVIFFTTVASASAQRGQTFFELKESKPLLIFLQEIEQDFGLVFSYPDRLAEQVKIAPGRWEAESVEALLTALCAQNNLEYRFSEQGDVLLRARLQPKINTKVPDQWLVRGRVVDPEERPISDVAIYLDTLHLGALSDEQGRFQFAIPYTYKNRQLIFQFLGYQRLRLPVSQLDELSSVQLRQSSIDLEPITVTRRIPGLQQLRSDGAIRLTSFEGIEPGSIAGGDIFRTIQLLPGVSAHDDLSAAIKIRGSGSDETLVVLDGIPIYRAEHFFGVFSAVNSSYVQQSTLFKNALPAAFGGKTGGMLLMESNGELYNRLSADLDINLLTSSAVLRVPLGERAALSLSGRTTYQNAASNPIFDAFDTEMELATQIARENFTRPDLLTTIPVFQFYDFNARFAFQLNDRSALDLNYYQSQDDFSNEYENTFRARIGPTRFAENREVFSNLEAWTNRGASLNYRYDFPRSWQFKTNLYYSRFENLGEILSSLSRIRPAQDIELWSFENRQNNHIEDFGAKVLLSKALPQQRSLDAGLELIQHSNTFRLQEEERTMLENESAAYEAALFVTSPLVNREKAHLELGNRLIYYSATDQFYWSPRLKLRYDWHAQGYFKAAFTRSNQFVREFVHNNRLGQSLSFFSLSDGKQFPVGRSNNYMLGSSWQLGDWSLDLELYQKDFTGLIEYARLFQGFDPDEINPGKLREYAIFNGQGNTHGLDFMLSLDKEDYQGWLSYTWSKTTHEFDKIYRGASFPAEDDRRHQLSWVNNYRWQDLSFSATYVLASGRPFFNLAQLRSPEDLRQINPSQLFDRLPAYHRLDLGVSYQFAWQWADCSLGLSVFNVTNRANVKYQQFVYSVPYLQRDKDVQRDLNQVIGNTIGMLNRTLNFSFSVQF